MIFALDTTAFSAAMRNEPGMARFMGAHRPGEIATVPPVVAEIEHGIRRLDPSSRKFTLLLAQKEKLFQIMQVLDWDQESSAKFGKIKADLENAGTPVDDFDVAIAAIAMSHGAVLITANLAHFKRIKGLQSNHWDG